MLKNKGLVVLHNTKFNVKSNDNYQKTTKKALSLLLHGWDRNINGSGYYMIVI